MNKKLAQVQYFLWSRRDFYKLKNVKHSAFLNVSIKKLENENRIKNIRSNESAEMSFSLRKPMKNTSTLISYWMSLASSINFTIQLMTFIRANFNNIIVDNIFINIHVYYDIQFNFKINTLRKS